MVWIGWILASWESRHHLGNLGVKWESFNETQQVFEGCEVSEDTLEKLDRWWGEYIWGFEEVKSEPAA